MKQKPFPKRAGEKPMSSTRRGNQWEKNVVAGIAEYLDARGSGVVIHLEQVMHGMIREPQIVDLLVDNAGGRNFGIECKASGMQKPRIALWFGGIGSPQFIKEEEFFYNANRIGLIAFMMPELGSTDAEIRYGSYLIPWSVYPSLADTRLTTSYLDSYVGAGLIYKIPTTDGTVHLPPEEDVFAMLAKVEKKYK